MKTNHLILMAVTLTYCLSIRMFCQAEISQKRGEKN